MSCRLFRPQPGRSMDLQLTLYQTRVLGCLLEKEVTTPDQYPLSLNALTNACNQKSNRGPVLNLSEADVQQTVDSLKKEYLVAEKSGAGSRVAKLVHRFGNTEFGPLQLSQQERGIMCLLFVRGAQTPGELRTRSNRLCEFADVQEVESVLQALMQRSDGAMVARLPREAGKRESRYVHLLSPEDERPEVFEITAEAKSDASVDNRIEGLQVQLNALRDELDQVKNLLAKQED